MIKLNISHTELRPDGLRFDPVAGALLVPPSRLKIDPSNPRLQRNKEQLKSLRSEIDEWRERGRGIAGSGIFEPLKGRWEPGTLGRDGNPTKTSKILVWDGGSRLLITQEDYSWLPLVFDDLNTKEARDAALRTSIHRQSFSKIEQAHAIAEKMADEGWGVPRTAQFYKVSPGWINNRLPLLEMPPYLQQMVEEDPHTMSHALAIHAARGQIREPDAKAFARRVIDERLGIKPLKAEIDWAIHREKQGKAATQAPDRETQQRTGMFAEREQAVEVKGMAGSLSRGIVITKTRQKQSEMECSNASLRITGALQVLNSFVGDVSTEHFEKDILPRIADWRRQIDRLESRAK